MWLLHKNNIYSPRWACTLILCIRVCQSNQSVECISQCHHRINQLNVITNVVTEPISCQYWPKAAPQSISWKCWPKLEQSQSVESANQLKVLASVAIRTTTDIANAAFECRKPETELHKFESQRVASRWRIAAGGFDNNFWMFCKRLLFSKSSVLRPLNPFEMKMPAGLLKPVRMVTPSKPEQIRRTNLLAFQPTESNITMGKWCEESRSVSQKFVVASLSKNCTLQYRV